MTEPTFSCLEIDFTETPTANSPTDPINKHIVSGKMSGTETTQECRWTRNNLQKLFAAMKSNIPQRQRDGSYMKVLKNLDWSQVAFPPFSPEECQASWRNILQKMRKVRSLTELIDEADNFLSNPDKNSKIHPAFPKRPCPPNTLFYGDNIAKLKEQHPELNSNQAATMLAKRYNALPDTAKAFYVKKHQRAATEYKMRLKEFREHYGKPPKDECQQKKKKTEEEEKEEEEEEQEEEEVEEEGEDEEEEQEHNQDTKVLPLKPPRNGYNLFCKKQMKSLKGSLRKDFGAISSQRWQALTEKERQEYIKRCRELNKQYAIKLNQYLWVFDEDEQEQILRDNGIKRSKESKIFPGEPKMPARDANQIFVKNQMELLREEVPNSQERLVRVNKMWHDLPTKEKEFYKRKANETIRKYSQELQKWFKTLTAEEQVDYQCHDPSKCQYLDAKVMRVHDREEPYANRPSDSEDEDLGDSSSGEEDNMDYEEGEEKLENCDDIFGIW